MRRILMGLLAVGGSVLFFPSVASAAAPTNDTLAGATAVPSLPFIDSVDVSQATTDSTDAQLNAQCGAPATDNSIWYTYTATGSEGGLVVDVSQSDHSSGVIVAEGGPGNWQVDACGPGTVGTPVTGGVTYYILAFNDTPGQTGGIMRVNIQAAQIPTVSLSVDPRGKVDKFGNAYISGLITCANASQGAQIEVSVTQPVGRFSIQGSGFSASSCGGPAQQWTAQVVPSNGKFAGGKSLSVAVAIACGDLFCNGSFATQVVKLSK
jgi:hypothetical protein